MLDDAGAAATVNMAGSFLVRRIVKEKNKMKIIGENAFTLKMENGK